MGEQPITTFWLGSQGMRCIFVVSAVKILVLIVAVDQPPP